MDTILVNFYNQTSAGPKNIALNFISEALKSTNLDRKIIIIIPDIEDYMHMKSTETVQFLKIRKRKSFLLKAVFRFYFDLFFIPIFVMKNNIKSFLAFGNYLISPLYIKKVVLLHHPYLVDDNLLNKLSLKNKFIEKLRRGVFYFTKQNSNIIVVQSAYMEEQFNTVWNATKLKKTKIIHNPISNSFNGNFTKNDLDIVNIDRSKYRRQNKIKILYVSRFYPHKNHFFLLKLAEKMKMNNIEFYVTLNNEINGVSGLLDEIKKKKLNIINIGELSQKDLESYYKNSHLFLFPSKSETFGNPLIEAMKYGLPILVPDVPYANSVVGSAGVYYEEDNIVDCIEKISNITSNDEMYEKYSIASFEHFKNYSNSGEWFKTYLSLLL